MPSGGMLTVGLLAGGGALAGGLSNSQGARTSTQTPTFTPDQTGLQGTLFDALKQRLTNPAQSLDPFRVQGTGEINNNFNTMNQRLQQDASSRGFGLSGPAAMGAQQLEIGRQGQLGSLESSLAQFGINQQQQTLQQALQYAFADPGKTSVGAGSEAGGILSGGIGGLLGGLGLTGLGGGGGGTGGGGGGAYDSNGTYLGE